MKVDIITKEGIFCLTLDYSGTYTELPTYANLLSLDHVNFSLSSNERNLILLFYHGICFCCYCSISDAQANLVSRTEFITPYTCNRSARNGHRCTALLDYMDRYE